jgi:hypothetical protein
MLQTSPSKPTPLTMKKLVLGAVALTTLAGTAFAAFSLGNNATVFFTGNFGVRYDDNIQLGDGTINPKISDTIFEFDPGLELDLGKPQANFSATLAFVESLTRYVDTTNLDAELASINLKSAYNAPGKYTSGFHAGYSQFNQNTPISGVPGLLRRNVTNVGGDVKYDLTAKSQLGVGLSYDQTDYKTAGLSNSKIYTVPVNYYYPITEKLFLTPGIRYRKTQLSAPGTDFTDYYYSLGLVRDIDPLLTGTFSIGLNHRQPQVGKTESSIGLDSSLAYKYTEKTNLTFKLSNDFGNASVGTSQQTLTIGGGVNHVFAPDWSGSANINYSSTKYAGTRKDEYWDFDLSAQYTVNRYWSLSLSYDYKDNSSSLGGANTYKDNLLSLKASVRY